jgi:hypothetical protein
MADAVPTQTRANCGPWIELSDSEINDFRILLDCDTGLANYPLTAGVRQFVLINSGNTVARANQPALQAELMGTLAERRLP